MSYKENIIKDVSILDEIQAESEKLGVVVPQLPSQKFMAPTCYNIGDVGPAGGIIVSIPGIGRNTGDFYIEDSLENIYVQDDPFNHPNPNPSVPPGGYLNPIWGQGGHNSGPYANGWQSTIYTTNHEVGAGWYNQQEMINSGVGINTVGPNAFTECENYTQNGFDDWYIPNALEWLEIIDNGWNDPSSPLYWGNSSSPNTAFGIVKYWTSTGSDADDNLQAKYVLGQPTWAGGNTFWDNVNNHIPWTPGTASPNTKDALAVNPNNPNPNRWYSMNRNSDVCIRAVRRFKCNPKIKTPCHKIGDIGPGGGMIFATPYNGWNNTKYYYEVGLKDISVGSTPLTGVASAGTCDVPGSSVTGAEFGIWGEQNVNTSVQFGDGYKNSIIIDSYPTAAGNPYLTTREIAATLCLDYAAQQQQVFEDGEGWFLPSLFEFWNMYNMVGPFTQYGATLNLSECTWGPNPNGTNAIFTSGYYWTSSEHSVFNSNPGNINVGNIPSTFTGEEQLAWSFINTSNIPQMGNSGQISMLQRCQTASVRPIRRFFCPDELKEEDGIDYNFRYRNYHTYMPDPNQTGGFAGSENPGMISTCLTNSTNPDVIGGQNGDYNIIYFPTVTASGRPFFYKPGSGIMNYGPDLKTALNHSMTGFANTHRVYHITVWDKFENLLGKWRYRGDNGCIWCGNRCKVWMKFHLLGQLEGDNETITIPQDAYVKIEGFRESHPALAPDTFTNTKDLENYCGTGVNLRCIDSTGAIINNSVNYWEICVKECKKFFSPSQMNTGQNGCRWWAVAIPPPPNGFTFVNPVSSAQFFSNWANTFGPPGSCDTNRCQNTPGWTPAAPKLIGPPSDCEECDCPEKDDGSDRYGVNVIEGVKTVATSLNKFAQRIKKKFR